MQITPLIHERESNQTQSALVLGVEMRGGTVRCLGTVQLQSLCRSGAQSKPCTSAPPSFAWIQQNEAEAAFKSQHFAFKQAAL